MTSAPSAAIVLTAKESLAWYKSSEIAERGFCRDCGSNLFWREFGSDTTSITGGTLDAAAGLKIERHIFVRDKAEYYTITDGAPQFDE